MLHPTLPLMWNMWKAADQNNTPATRDSLVGGFHVADKLQEHKGCHGLRSKHQSHCIKSHAKMTCHISTKSQWTISFRTEKVLTFLYCTKTKKSCLHFWQFDSWHLNHPWTEIVAAGWRLQERPPSKFREWLEWDNHVEMWEDGRLAHACVSNMEKLSSLWQCMCI